MKIISIDSLFKFCFLCVVSLVLSGCVLDSIRTHSESIKGIEKENINHVFVSGVTTKKDVLIRLGPPDNNYEYMKSNVWRYHYRHEKIPFLLPRVSALTGVDKVLKLNFDENGVISHADLVEKYAK
ncbi:hypothetical protein HKX68_05940 [Dickeya dadantii]|uniref:hypothetical protein n=1 Tax=Dickeya dadantii TaxID=204038 RepID=UPI001373400D|nr:hypothetical protein [Dickeya dadantii]NPE62552.1 hypothetical protein [Dickeya dadantii]